VQLLRKTPPRSSALRLTALIDVVFLLIIFFMTVTRLSTDQYEKLPLPVADQSSIVEDRENRVIVNLSRTGQVIVQKRPVTLPELHQMLVINARRIGLDRIKCVLRIDRNTAFKDVQKVLGTVAHAGIWQIAYAVTEDKQP